MTFKQFLLEYSYENIDIIDIEKSNVLSEKDLYIGLEVFCTREFHQNEKYVVIGWETKFVGYHPTLKTYVMLGRELPGKNNEPTQYIKIYGCYIEELKRSNINFELQSAKNFFYNYI